MPRCWFCYFFLILFLWVLWKEQERVEIPEMHAECRCLFDRLRVVARKSRGGNRTYKHLILVEVSTNTYIILIISRKSPIPTVSLQCLILVEVITKNDHKYDLIDLHAHGGALALYCCMYIIRSDHQVYTSMVDG